MSQKAATLAHLLTPLKRYHGKKVLIKYGGNAMTDQSLQKSFAQDIALLKYLGILPIVVHGGGPQIDHALQKIGKQGTFIQGMRVTDDETMSVVEWVLGGQVQQEIVSMINQAGAKSLGLTGKDGHFIQVEKARIPNAEQAGQFIDLGRVGEIQHIDTTVIDDLLDKGFIPVVSPIGINPTEGLSYNVNADTVAGELAKALQAEQLLLMTNISGVLNKSGELIPQLSAEKIQQLFDDGTITGGMIPKIASALEAAQSGVKSVYIVDGRIPHCLLLALLTDDHVGTQISVNG